MEIRLRNIRVGCVLQMRVSDKGSLAQTHDLESQAEEAKKSTIQSKIEDVPKRIGFQLCMHFNDDELQSMVRL
jgi:hypothetical protein